MRYVVAFFLPPVGILMCKRYGHFTVNLIMCIIAVPLMFFLVGFPLWLICISHALTVCKMSSFDKRIDRVVKAIEGRTQAAAAPAAVPTAVEPTETD